MPKSNLPALRGRFIEANKASSPNLEAFEIPQWGITVYLRQMSVVERQALTKDTERAFLERIVATSLADESGERLFNPEDASDLEFLGNCPSVILDRISDAAIRINGLSPKAMDDLEKNLGTTRTD